MHSRRETVDRAIEFRDPERVPIVFWNRDQSDGDVMLYHLSLGEPGDGDPSVNAWDWSANEWGYRLESLDDGTMGHPIEAFWPDLPAGRGRPGPAACARRTAWRRVPAFFDECGDRYRLASLDLSGFTVYTLLRGFENACRISVEPERFGTSMDLIFDFECDLIDMAARHGFHGIHFADDWGTQSGLMISPELWRSCSSPATAGSSTCAHELGLDVWFHCCGNFADDRRRLPRDRRRRAEHRPAQRRWTWQPSAGSCGASSVS